MAQLFQVMFLGRWLSKIGSKKFRLVMASVNARDLGLISGLVQSGKVIPAIDRCYPLSRAAEALRYLGEGHARGKIIITLE